LLHLVLLANRAENLLMGADLVDAAVVVGVAHQLPQYAAQMGKELKAEGK